MPDAMDKITAYLARVREREQAATAGPWHLETDSCDCGGDYPCRHGVFPWALVLPVAKMERAETDPFRPWDFKYSEISELPMETAEFIVEARADVPRLLAAVETTLELHVPVDRGRVMNCCRGCEEENGTFHEDCCHEWPCPTYLAISAVLAGTGETSA